jgi:hypothetical protein
MNQPEFWAIESSRGWTLIDLETGTSVIVRIVEIEQDAIENGVYDILDTVDRHSRFSRQEWLRLAGRDYRFLRQRRIAPPDGGTLAWSGHR